MIRFIFNRYRLEFILHKINKQWRYLLIFYLIPMKCESYETEQKGEKAESDEQKFRTIELGGRRLGEEPKVPGLAPV